MLTIDQLRENQLLTMLVAMLPARLLVPKALPARLEALLNLSQREKARVFMMVRTRAMTRGRVSRIFHGAGCEAIRSLNREDQTY